MRSDIDIKREVEAELRANPDIDTTDITVTVKNGVVTLSGFVRSYGQKYETEQTAKGSTTSLRWRTTSKSACRS